MARTHYSRKQAILNDFYEERPALRYDRTFHAVFDAAMFDFDQRTQRERETIYADLIEYIWDTYELDFQDTFDWEAWADWYDAVYGS